MQQIAYLNSNDGTGILAWGVEHSLIAGPTSGLSTLQEFLNHYEGDYRFLCLSYDLKNDIEKLDSNNLDGVKFPKFIAWVPQYVVEMKKESYRFLKGEKSTEAFEFLQQFLEEETDHNFHPYNFNFQARTSKEDYLEKVKNLQKAIQRGDIYEVNYCQEYFAENVDIDFALDTYFKLNYLTQAPFSGYISIGDFQIFCGSPERFLKRSGNKLISQPIKGTAPRGETPEKDEHLKKQLQQNPKERAENVMIVDLVRNDFSQIATAGSVNVEELCEIYSFETVHQMISTVACEVRSEATFSDILRATFPMGSMTGAPKISAMQHIEEAEDFQRGIYSGSIGYIDPTGDFDLNVVIRTLVYNRKEKYLSCGVGSAITILSNPEDEFQECQTKVKRILDGMQQP